MDSECDAISSLDGRLYVGNYAAAQDGDLLDQIGVTHIISAGFRSGHFHSDRYKYLCIDIRDDPEENLLQYLPRSTSFIGKALQDNGIVFVHCVHGQSRSCAICVAYLLMKQQQSQSSDPKLLHKCYDEVESARPCMAINPGFVRQLELYRRMICCNIESNSGPPASRPHAAFRSFRSRSEYVERCCISKWFPRPAKSVPNTYQCKKCRFLLFFDHNIIEDWTESDQFNLPKSEYWAKSAGGLEYARNATARGSCKGGRGDRHTGGADTLGYKIEPIDWMKSQMESQPGGSILQQSGKLVCPSCSGKIGHFDWGYQDLYCSIFIVPSKVENR